MKENDKAVAVTAKRLLEKGVDIDAAMKELGCKDARIKKALADMFAQIDAAVDLGENVKTLGLAGALRSQTERGFTDKGLDEIAGVTAKYLATMTEGV